MRHLSKQKQDDLKSVEKIRAHYSLSPIKKGKRLCLKCDRLFKSDDLANQKTCGYCRQEKIMARR